MNEPIALHELMAEWVDAIDPEVENRYRQQLCRDAYDRGHGHGYDAGYMCAIAEIKAVQQDLVSTLGDLGETLEKRWTLRGEKRTQATFSQPHPGDFTGRSIPRNIPQPETRGQQASEYSEEYPSEVTP